MAWGTEIGLFYKKNILYIYISYRDEHCVMQRKMYVCKIFLMQDEKYFFKDTFK